MKKLLCMATMLSSAAMFSSASQSAPLDLSPLVPADLVTTITAIGVGQLLPIAGGLIDGNPIVEPILGNAGLAEPLTDLILGGDTLKGLANFYGPVDALLTPLVALTSQDGAAGVLSEPLDLFIGPANGLLETLGGGAESLNGLGNLDRLMGVAEPVLVILTP